MDELENRKDELLDEIEKIQEALDVIEGLINSIKTKNPDAEIVLDSRTDGVFFILGTRNLFHHHSNGGDWWNTYCYEDVIHRFNDCGIVGAEMDHASDYR